MTNAWDKPGYWNKPDRKLESDVQSEIIEVAHMRGWWCEKIESRSGRGIMDLLCIRHGRHVFVEAKREGEEARRQQEKRAREIRAHGGEVYTIDSVEEARRILK